MRKYLMLTKEKQILKNICAILLLLFFSQGSYAEQKNSITEHCFTSIPFTHVVFDNNHPLYAWNLKSLNLTIAEKVFERAKNGAGFSTRNYNSWKDWYAGLSWTSGLTLSGIYEYGIRESETYWYSRSYGLKFNDGSFSVGVIGEDAKNGSDNWTTITGSNWGSEYDYAGQMFFDKNGRPVALAITNKTAADLGTGWSYIYKNGKWEYESKDDWDERRFSSTTMSLDPHAPRFLIN